MNPDNPTGFLLVDKPPGMTSHDVVDVLRKSLGIKKIGHAGTLDPFATGLLIMAVGRGATREISRFVGLDKVYDSTFVLGATSTTHDPEGEITMTKPESFPIKDEIENVLSSMVGEQDQIPPMHAAIKVDGKKLYELAREGKTIDIKPRRITIHSTELLSYEDAQDETKLLNVQLDVSSGTYIRAIARDLGESLGTGAYTLELRRTSIGPFDIQNAFSIENCQSGSIELTPTETFINTL